MRVCQVIFSQLVSPYCAFSKLIVPQRGKLSTVKKLELVRLGRQVMILRKELLEKLYIWLVAAKEYI